MTTTTTLIVPTTTTLISTTTTTLIAMIYPIEVFLYEGSKIARELGLGRTLTEKEAGSVKAYVKEIQSEGVVVNDSNLRMYIGAALVANNALQMELNIANYLSLQAARSAAP